MTNALGIDYAWTHPDPAKIKAAGYEYVLRYLSNDPSKNLSVAERDALLLHEIGIGVVWETTANRILGGEAAGAIDGPRAQAQADNLGLPQDVPIYFACDVDTKNYDTVAAYLRAADSRIARPVGIYGSIWVVDEMLRRGAAVFGWQTVAWSGGRISQIAHLYQRQKPTRGLEGGGYDENATLQDNHGVWYPFRNTQEPPVEPPAPPQPPTPAPAPPPAPQPAPAEPEWTQEMIMNLPTLRKGDKGQYVKNVQGLLTANGVPSGIDGDFGPKTDSSVKTFQARRGLASDGVVGPKTHRSLVGA